MFMQTNLWEECLYCKDKCCKWDIAFPLFVTSEERKKAPLINTRHPCIFYDKNELCDIHKIRPFDCRFFPFDILKLNEKFFWIIWKFNCPILNKNKEEFEQYLEEHEKELIPKFIEYLDNYSKFRLKELLSKYQYEVLREVKF